jgi:nucleotide-binding universal stress UspA family protein
MPGALGLVSRHRCLTFAARDLRHLPCGRAHYRPWKEAAVREINHILCPVDLSSVSKSALAHAFAWARWYGAEVHVLHVAPIPVAVPGMPGVIVTLDSGSLVHTQLEVQHFVQEVRLTGVPSDVRVLHGDPAAIIVDEAKRYRNTLVILGSRASRGLERVMLGSVAERLLHRTQVPTLVVSATNEVALSVVPKFKRIVCGVNLHLSSLEALRFALSVATESDAELRIVSVLEPLAAVLPLGTPTHVIAEHRERQRQLSLCAIRQHVPDEARQACTIREEAYIGEPVGTLLQIAQAGAAELLIVGTGDRPHLQALWRGRTTDRLIRNSTCPVLVVPTPSAVRRAASMTVGPVALDQWRPLLDRMSGEHQGCLTTVTIIDKEMSAMPEATALPLTGIVVDHSGGQPDTIELILGDREQSHLTHVIDRPTELRVERLWLNSVRLLISDASGTATLVEIAAVPQAIESLAVAAPPF